MKIWHRVETDYDRCEHKQSQWKIRTNDDIIDLEKAIQDVRKSLLFLPFEKPSSQFQVEPMTFYKNALIYHRYECHELDSKVNDLRSVDKESVVAKVKAFLE